MHFVRASTKALNSVLRWISGCQWVPDFLSIVNMVGPNPCTMALMEWIVPKLRKKLGITPRSMERMWVCTFLGALTWRAFCLLKLLWTLAGSGLMLSKNACIASRDTSAQLTVALWLPAAAFCRRGVDIWVERWWAVLSREAFGTDVLCKEGKSWWCFKQAPRSPFHGLRWDAFRAKAKWTLRSSCYRKIFTNQKQSRSSSRYIFRFSYEIGVFPCSSASVLSRLFLVLQIALRHAL